MAFNIDLTPYQLNEITSKDTFLTHYNATDNNGAKYKISEFFPQYMVNRSPDGTVSASERFASEFIMTLERFKNGCDMIQGLRDTAFNPIVNVVDKNNTAYMVRKECIIPSLTTYMGGLKMDFYEAYVFMRPFLMFLAQAVMLEVDEYVEKTQRATDLIAALTDLRDGKERSPNHILSRMAARMKSKRKPAGHEIPLTGRELQVLRHIAFGMSNREIARSLEISVDTVKEHVQNILRKMGFRDRTHAAVWAVRSKII